MKKFMKISKTGEKEVVYAEPVYSRDPSGSQIVEEVVMITQNGDVRVLPDTFYDEYQEYICSEHSDSNLSEDQATESDANILDTDNIENPSHENWSSEGIYQDDVVGGEISEQTNSEGSDLENKKEEDFNEVHESNTNSNPSPDLGTVARTIFLIISLLLSVGYQTGKITYEIDENKLYELVITLMTIVSSIMCWWKNNSFTKEAIEADSLMKIAKEIRNSNNDTGANG